jgi:hypothetical protein
MTIMEEEIGGEYCKIIQEYLERMFHRSIQLIKTKSPYKRKDMEV